MLYFCARQSTESNYSNWIALYKCSSNRNLEEFIAVETSLTIQSPTKHGLIPVIFHLNQLKNVKCNEAYEFLYGNKFNEVVNTFYHISLNFQNKYLLHFSLQICGISQPVHFIHKNDCYCYPNAKEIINNCNGCVSQVICQLCVIVLNIFIKAY